MRDVFDLQKITEIDKSDTYIRSYAHLLNCIGGYRSFGEQEFVCACHMIYGWMPTILELKSGNGLLDPVGDHPLGTKARTGRSLTDEEITQLAQVINNSLVGASKLLHFVAPDAFAIWDSRIHRFLFPSEAPHNYRVNKIERYRAYLELLSGLKTDKRFDDFHKSVCRKVGYTVSGMRAIELVMFMWGGQKPSPDPKNHSEGHT